MDAGAMSQGSSSFYQVVHTLKYLDLMRLTHQMQSFFYD